MREQRDADARTQIDVAPGEREGTAQDREQIVGHRGRRLGGGAGQQHREFVAAEAREHAVARQRLADAVAEGAQHHVAGMVAEAVVDLLEIVEIDEQQRERPAALDRGGERGIERGLEGGAIGQAGDGVVRRGPVEPVLRGLFGSDVLGGDDHPDQPAGVVIDRVRRYPAHRAVALAEDAADALVLVREIAAARAPLQPGIGVASSGWISASAVWLSAGSSGSTPRITRSSSDQWSVSVRAS